jgi:hypothetical protein
MSAIERGHDVEHVASVTQLPSRAIPDPTPPAVHLPSASQIADFVTPPDIWSDDRPSLRKIWLYGVYGRWTAATGPLRVAGAVYASLAALIHAAAYMVLWIVERPARFAVAAALVGLTILAL